MWTWYLTRGTGAAALVLLTGSVVIGTAHSLRWRGRGLPRFLVDDLHRMLSLLALGLVTAHVTASVLDSFAPVSIRDAFVPFAGTYRPTWLGLGAIAFDLMLVLTLTSLWRARIGYRTWRAIHWLAWASWPPALVHTFGTGSDLKRGWMLVLAVACAAAVVITVGARLWKLEHPQGARIRTAGVLATVGGAIALAAWVPQGPLGTGWARRSGTPLSLLQPKPATYAAAATARVSTKAPRVQRVEAAAHQLPLTTDARGHIHEGVDSSGTALVDIALETTHPERRRIDVRIAGAPVDGGGVSLQRSQVTFGPPSDPARYQGHLIQLEGTRMEARLRPLRGPALDLRADLQINEAAGAADGRVEVRPAS